MRKYGGQKNTKMEFRWTRKMEEKICCRFGRENDYEIKTASIFLVNFLASAKISPQASGPLSVFICSISAELHGNWNRKTHRLEGVLNRRELKIYIFILLTAAKHKIKFILLDMFVFY